MKKGDKVRLIKSPSADYPKLYNEGVNEYFKVGSEWTVQTIGEFECDIYGIMLVGVETTTFPVECLELIK